MLTQSDIVFFHAVVRIYILERRGLSRYIRTMENPAALAGEKKLHLLFDSGPNDENAVNTQVLAHGCHHMSRVRV